MTSRSHHGAARRALAGVIVVAAVVTGWASPANAAVATTIGSAYGFMARVQTFADPVQQVGPTPTVTLPPGGSPTLTQTNPSGSAIIGPATIFSSGQLTASTQGTTGPGGSVTSSATVQNVNLSLDEVLTATQIRSTCTATETGITASTTITGGTLRTDSGDDNPANTIPDHPEVVVALGTSPAPNTEITGHIHIGNVTDQWRYVFNEQIQNPDGSITVNAAHQYLLGPSAVGDLIIGQSVCGVKKTQRAIADYNGDNASDFSFFRPSTGVWYSAFSSGGATAYTWGVGTDIPVPGDYNGDGKADFAVFRPSTGGWYVAFNGGGATSITWGGSGDLPVQGDYDGDGTTDFAFFRPSTGIWYIAYTGGGADALTWGVSTDIPVPGDYNGDGKNDFAVFRPSTGGWYVAFTGGGAASITWGGTGDIPAPGDYNGDGTTDFAFFRPSNGIWYIAYTGGGGTSITWGVGTDIPVPGDYNGDGSTDFAVFRPSTGGWYVAYTGGGGTSITWGGAGDVPLLLPYPIWLRFYGGV